MTARRRPHPARSHRRLTVVASWFTYVAMMGGFASSARAEEVAKLARARLVTEAADVDAARRVTTSTSLSLRGNAIASSTTTSIVGVTTTSLGGLTLPGLPAPRGGGGSVTPGPSTSVAEPPDGGFAGFPVTTAVPGAPGTTAPGATLPPTSGAPPPTTTEPPTTTTTGAPPPTTTEPPTTTTTEAPPPTTTVSGAS